MQPNGRQGGIKQGLEGMASVGADPSDILKNMLEVYAKCRSYRDTGLATTMYVSGPKTHTAKTPFSTAFVRPNGFRFEFRDNHGHDEYPWNQYAIWLEGGCARSWWTLRKQDRGLRPLADAIGAAVGVSSGTAILVPSMLLPVELEGARLAHVKNLSFAPEADVAGRRCIVMKGADQTGEHLIYVDAETMLLRRVDEPDRDVGMPDVSEPPPLPESLKKVIPAEMIERVFEEHRKNAHPTTAKSTKEYSPEIDVELASEDLIFKPPTA